MKPSIKVIVITGASDGIGAEIARQLAESHGKDIALVLAARNVELLNNVAAQCATYGAQTLIVQTDVSVQAQCVRLAAATVERFGRIDVLINNAGRSGHAWFSDVQDLGWYEDMMRVNLWGSVWCTHAMLPYLKASRGSVVAVSSLAGVFGIPGRTAYNASKFAMTGFFEGLRVELKPAGVSVTIAFPGVVATQLRYRGYNAQGGELKGSSVKEDKAMPVQECAALIIAGMQKRKREVVMTAKGKLGRFMKLLAPGVLEKKVWAALKDEALPR